MRVTRDTESLAVLVMFVLGFAIGLGILARWYL